MHTVWCVVCMQSMVVFRGLGTCKCVACVCFLGCKRLCGVWLFGGLWWEADHMYVSGLCLPGGAWQGSWRVDGDIVFGAWVHCVGFPVFCVP